jgi:hypothetical protein
VYGPFQAMDIGAKLRTAHTQQLTLLLKDNAKFCDQRQAFITDLEKFITLLILGIDTNETFYDEIGESAILGLVERCGLIDGMASMNPDDPPPPKRCNSKRRVDFIFATAGIHKNITRYGMLPNDSIFYSEYHILIVPIICFGCYLLLEVDLDQR